MMGTTHLTTGIAAALAVSRPASMSGMLACIAGGAVGGILCDIEVRSMKKKRDALVARVMCFVIVATVFAADWYLQTGLWQSMMRQDPYLIAFGELLLLSVCVKGRFSAHRTFTHSLLYAALLSLSIWCICPDMLLPFACGILSHLVLDTLNKRTVPWLYPLKTPGLCLRLFYANKTANTILLWTAFAADLALICWRTYIIVG